MKSILLVEDDPFLIDIYKAKLKQLGFLVEVISDGGMVLRTLEEKRFDLLILDIVLPNVDGWKILERIKEERSKIENLRSLKIVILSNLGQKEEIEKGLGLGANKYLVKAHYTPSQIAEEVKKLLNENYGG